MRARTIDPNSSVDAMNASVLRLGYVRAFEPFIRQCYLSGRCDARKAGVYMEIFLDYARQTSATIQLVRSSRLPQSYADQAWWGLSPPNFWIQKKFFGYGP